MKKTQRSLLVLTTGLAAVLALFGFYFYTPKHLSESEKDRDSISIGTLLEAKGEVLRRQPGGALLSKTSIGAPVLEHEMIVTGKAAEAVLSLGLNSDSDSASDSASESVSESASESVRNSEPEHKPELRRGMNLSSASSSNPTGSHLKKEGAVSRESRKTHEAIVRIHEHSRLVAEVDATKANSLILTILEGSISVEKESRRGLLRIFREGREISTQESHQLPLPVVVESSPGLGISPPTEGNRFDDLVVLAMPDEKVSSPPANVPVAKFSDNGTSEPPRSPISVSDADIKRELEAQSGFFRRCYLNYLDQIASSEKDDAPMSGRVVVGFSIQSSGKVTNVKIVRSEFASAPPKNSANPLSGSRDQSHESLHRCLIEAVERTSFSAFDANAIDVLEFPITLR